MQINHGCSLYVNQNSQISNHSPTQQHRCGANNFTFSQAGLSPVSNMATPFSSAVQQFGGEQQLFRNPQAGQFFHAMFQLVNALTQLLTSTQQGGFGSPFGPGQAGGIGQQAPQGFGVAFGGDPFSDVQAPFDLPQLKMTACPAASFENPFSDPSLGCGGNPTSNAYFQLLGEQVRGIR